MRQEERHRAGLAGCHGNRQDTASGVDGAVERKLADDDDVADVAGGHDPLAASTPSAIGRS